MWGLELDTAGWVGLWVGIALFVITVACIITAIVLAVSSKKTRNTGDIIGVFSVVAVATTIFGLLFFLPNLFTGMEKRDVLHDLTNAGWEVVSVDTGRDIGVVALGDAQVSVALRQVGPYDTWIPYVECSVRPAEKGPQVDLQNCSRTLGK